jgi:hypothetical protein
MRGRRSGFAAVAALMLLASACRTDVEIEVAELPGLDSCERPDRCQSAASSKFFLTRTAASLAPHRWGQTMSLNTDIASA